MTIDYDRDNELQLSLIVFSRREARITTQHNATVIIALVYTTRKEEPKGYLSTEQEVICFNVTIRPINSAYVVQNLLTAHGSLIRGTGPSTKLLFRIGSS